MCAIIFFLDAANYLFRHEATKTVFFVLFQKAKAISNINNIRSLYMR